MSKKLVKLKDVCTFVNGRAYKQDELLDTGKYPVLRVGNFFSKSDWYYSDLELPEDKYCVDGDLLFAWSASFGPKIWAGGKVIYHYHIWKIILSEYLHREYLYYYLKNESERIKSSGHGATMIHVTKGGMEERDFFLPDILTQKKASEVLLKIERIIEYKKQQLADLDTLIKSRFVEMFGNPVSNSMCWEVKELNEICDVRDGTHDSPLYVSDGYPLVTSKNIIEGKLDLINVNYITPEDYESINKRSKVDKGDIIMPMIGTIGNPLIILQEPRFAIKNVALIKFNKTLISNVYIHTILCSELMEQIKEEKGRGGTQKFLALGDIRKLQIPVPNGDLQNQFATFVQQVDKLKFKVQTSLDETEMLFDSLMQEYFE